MPHEFKELVNLSHDMLGFILVGGLANAAVIVGWVIFQRRKHRKTKDKGPSPSRRQKQRRRRRQ